jgi:hypothetical protein
VIDRKESQEIREEKMREKCDAIVSPFISVFREENDKLRMRSGGV